jgi:hypothetical protein
LYPAKAVAQGVTRQQVKAELMDAIRTGNIIADVETGKKLNEIYPQRYSRVN